MKKLIEFKQSEYNFAIRTINEIVDTANKALDILIANGYEKVDYNTIKELTYNRKEFIDNEYRKALDKFLDFYAITFEEFSERSMTTWHQIDIAANRKINYLWSIPTVYYTQYFNEVYIQYNEGEFKLMDDYELYLKDLFSVFTENNKQNNNLTVYLDLCEQLNKLNNEVNYTMIPPLIYRDINTYRINGLLFKQVFV